MLNKVLAFLRRYDMVQPGDTVICAVSGGADSVALLWAMYIMRDKLRIKVEAAHFNHNLRGEESKNDEEFVRSFCDRYDIPLHVASEKVIAGQKGLEAAAREARYAFFETLPGKIATAHTADDNAETVLMHLVRGTGLRGLGGISPVRQRLIRPMLTVTRQDVLAFLAEYNLQFVQDSSNVTDQFLRNRLRHHVVPLLEGENPRFLQSVSAMALRLREDETQLEQITQAEKTLQVDALREMPLSLRSRVLHTILQDFGVQEPNAEHVDLLNDLVQSEIPSARANFPGGIVIGRAYGILEKQTKMQQLFVRLPYPGMVEIPELNLMVVCTPPCGEEKNRNQFVVSPVGEIVIRSRQSGDKLRMCGGTKTLKKLFVDAKIPASRRGQIPVIADDAGVLGVYGFGADLDRLASDGVGVQICFKKIKE